MSRRTTRVTAPVPSPATTDQRDASTAAAARPSEVTTVHTGILRCTLAIADARAYWAVPDPGPLAGRADRAFKEFWFGARSHARVATLLNTLRLRFDVWPAALTVLRAWPDMDPETRAAICHWHLQLSDPLYRAFTGEFLPRRRAEGRTDVTRALAVAWASEQGEHWAPGKWTMSTRIEFGSKLLSAAAEAGLVGSRVDPRPLRIPRVPDDALLYLLHLLRGLQLAGTLLENPYLASVGLTGDVLDARLRSLPGVRHARQGNVVDLAWQHASLATWFASHHAGATP